MSPAKPKDKLTKSERKRGWGKFILFLLILGLAFVLGGFLSFAQHVDSLKTPNLSTIENADGIVVWTGKGGGRLEAAGQLLTEGKGERLLVSGVNEDIALEKIAMLTGVSGDLAECCVDLDYAAKDTIGNARETASWAKAMNYKHIILVTSAYHMPRAQVEIGTAAGRMRITPVPVTRDNPDKWYQDGARFKRVTQEYSKLLLSYARGRRVETSNKTPILPAPETDSKTD